MSSELVSVIIPVYNAETYVEECIKSIVNQSYSNLEIIIVDDGSTDKSLSIVRNIANADRRIKVFQQKNSGVSKTRTNGIKFSTGDYLVFVDSDDWLDKDAIEKAVYLSKKNSADVVLWPYKREHINHTINNYLFNDSFIFWDKCNISHLYRRIIGPIEGELRMPQKLDSLSPVWGKLYKRDIVADLEFTELSEIGTSEDTLFNIEVFSKVKTAVYFSESFYHYRKYNDNSITHNYNKKITKKWKNLYQLIEKYLNETRASKCFYVALNNRISLGLIGLGINIAEDSSMTTKEKRRELKRILNLEQYESSLKVFNTTYLPFAWRVLFFFLKSKCIIASMYMFFLINRIRKLV